MRGWEPVWSLGPEQSSTWGARAWQALRGRLREGAQTSMESSVPGLSFLWRCVPLLMGCVLSAPYLDGEPAKAVLEVQRPLVSAEGNGMLGIQSLKLLLVVDHKYLPEETLVRIPGNTSTEGRAGEEPEEETIPDLGLVISGKGGLLLHSCIPPEVGTNVLVPTSSQSSS